MQIVAIITYNLLFLIITFALVDEIINSNLILAKSTNQIDRQKHISNNNIQQLFQKNLVKKYLKEFSLIGFLYVKDNSRLLARRKLFSRNFR